MGFQPSPELQREVDAVPIDFATNLADLTLRFRRFVELLRATTAALLQVRSSSAYGERATTRPHLLGYHQAVHLFGHLGQISMIRNLYQKTSGAILSRESDVPEITGGVGPTGIARPSARDNHSRGGRDRSRFSNEAAFDAKADTDACPPSSTREFRSRIVAVGSGWIRTRWRTVARHRSRANGRRRHRRPGRFESKTRGSCRSPVHRR
jgi:hypothetical protein